MNIEEIEQQLAIIEDSLQKLKDIVSDYKNCSSDTVKNILMAAIKKYSQPISDFKL